MTPDISFGWLFFKMILATLVVIGLAFWVLRYWLPRLQGYRPKGDSRVQILERLPLEPRKALYIIQVGKKRALVGTTDHQVNKLMDLEEEDLK